MTIVTATLNQLQAIAKPQRKFVAALLATILALRGRVNYRNLARYGDYSERTYARQFQQSFPWLEYHAKLIKSALVPTHKLIAAQDAQTLDADSGHRLAHGRRETAPRHLGDD